MKTFIQCPVCKKWNENTRKIYCEGHYPIKKKLLICRYNYEFIVNSIIKSILYRKIDFLEKRELEGIDRIREFVRLRDNYTCQKCGKKWIKGTRRFDVHHLNPEFESRKCYSYDAHNQDKMITLCHKCHLNLPHIRIRIGKRISRKNIK